MGHEKGTLSVAPGLRKPTDSKVQGFCIRIFASLLLLIVVLIFVRVLGFHLEYYDGYDNVHNARVLLGDESATFYSFRTPLPYLVLLPVVALLDQFPALDFLLLNHLFQFLLWGIALLLTLSCLRSLRCARVTSYFGTGILFGSPLVLHYGIFLTPSNCVLLAVPLCLLFVLKLRDRPTMPWALACGVILGIATLSRFQAVCLGPGIALFWVFCKPSGLSHKKSLTLLFVMGLTALLVWNGAFALVQYRAGSPRNIFLAGFQICLELGESVQGMVGNHNPTSRWFFFEVLRLNFGLPVTGLICVGLLRALFRRSTDDKLILALFVTTFGGGLLLPGTEARYLATAQFPLIYFAAIAFELLMGLSSFSVIQRLIVVLAGGLLVLNSLTELRHWQGLFQKVNPMERVASSLEKICQTYQVERVYWVNPPHAEFLGQKPLHPGDPYHGVYHLGVKALNCHINDKELRRRVRVIPPGVTPIEHSRYLVLRSGAKFILNFNRPKRPHEIQIYFVSIVDVDSVPDVYRLVKTDRGLEIVGGRGFRMVFFREGTTLKQKSWPNSSKACKLPAGAESIKILTQQRLPF